MAVISVGVSAQELNTAYFLDGYMYRHDMNPAMSSEKNYISIPALGNTNLTIRGNFGLKDVLFDNPLESGTTQSKTTFMNPYISDEEALSGFSKGNNRVVGDLSEKLLSAGFKAFGGYNTIELNIRASFGASVPYDLIEFARNTGNKYYSFDDVNINAQAYGELAFGHSRQLNDQWRVGAKVKFLIGLANIDAKISDLTADLEGDQWALTGHATVNASVKGLEYKSEEKAYKVPDDNGNERYYNQVNDVDVNNTGINGFGMALDLGATYQLNKFLTLSAALKDLGWITWKNNMLAENDGETFYFDGFHDISVDDGPGTSMDDQGDEYTDQLTDFAHLTDKGDQGSRSKMLGATLNIGAEYMLPAYDRLKFGFLSTTRINGAYSWTEARLSSSIEATKWFDAALSFSASSFAVGWGWVVNFCPSGFNFFIGMDHTMGNLSSEGVPLSSNANVTLGMNITW
jgi:hypothetical protein